MLIAAGANVNLVDEEGVTIPRLRELIVNGDDVDVQTSDGYTCLYSASQRGDLKVVQMLVFNSANVADDHGFIPLHVACLNGHRKVIEFLIKQLQSPHHPIQLAHQDGHREIIDVLSTAGAKLDQYCNKNEYFKDIVVMAWGQSMRSLAQEEVSRAPAEHSEKGKAKKVRPIESL
jgi:ankyrin repeat protein